MKHAALLWTQAQADHGLDASASSDHGLDTFESRRLHRSSLAREAIKTKMRGDGWMDVCKKGFRFTPTIPSHSVMHLQLASNGPPWPARRISSTANVRLDRELCKLCPLKTEERRWSSLRAAKLPRCCSTASALRRRRRPRCRCWEAMGGRRRRPGIAAPAPFRGPQ